jgi:putative N6-adenine-specific DNA methylase
MASAILFAGGVFSADILLDPMAGSGTFSLEAALWSQGFCPAKTRKTEKGIGYALGEQPAFKKAAWDHLVNKTEVPHPSSAMRIYCGDNDAKAFATLQHNLKVASPANSVESHLGDFFNLSPQICKSATLLVLNPPYGKRIKTDAVSLYAEIGKKIAQDFREISVAIVVPNEACHQALQLQPTSQIRTSHGGIDVTVEFR